MITENIKASLKETLDITWGDEMKGELQWEQCGFKVTSKQDAYIDDQEYAGTGFAPQKQENAQIAVDEVVEGYSKRYTMRTFALRMVVSEETILFKKYDKAVDGAGNIARSLKLTQEAEGAAVFINSFSSTYVGADGVSLCSTAHKLAKGGTYSNMFSTALSLSETAVEQMWVNMRKLPSSNGIQQGGVKLSKLVVPSDLRWRAMKILKSDQQNDTANNAINALKSANVTSVDNFYFTSTSNWWGTADVKAGLRWIWAKRPDFREENQRSNFSLEYSGVEIFDCGWTDPRGVYGSNI